MTIDRSMTADTRAGYQRTPNIPIAAIDAERPVGSHRAMASSQRSSAWMGHRLRGNSMSVSSASPPHPRSQRQPARARPAANMAAPAGRGIRRSSDRRGVMVFSLPSQSDHALPKYSARKAGGFANGFSFAARLAVLCPFLALSVRQGSGTTPSEHNHDHRFSADRTSEGGNSDGQPRQSASGQR